MFSYHSTRLTVHPDWPAASIALVGPENVECPRENAMERPAMAAAPRGLRNGQVWAREVDACGARDAWAHERALCLLGHPPRSGQETNGCDLAVACCGYGRIVLRIVEVDGGGHHT